MCNHTVGPRPTEEMDAQSQLYTSSYSCIFYCDLKSDRLPDQQRSTNTIVIVHTRQKRSALLQSDTNHRYAQQSWQIIDIVDYSFKDTSFACLQNRIGDFAM